MTNVPTPTFGPNGFTAPSEQAVYDGVFADIDAAFGGGLNPALSSPQGQLATSMAAIIGDANDTFVFYTNQVDPAFAVGRMQDAIARIYFLSRIGAAPTVVETTCTGLARAVIPAGSIAQASDGNLYISTDAATIGTGGTVSVTFEAQIPGPTACPADTLTSIYQAVPGWDSVNNPSDGVIGRATETRQQFEARRAASVAKNAVGSLPAIQGSVLEVDGILDAYVTENPTASPLTVGGVTLAAHSLYVAAVGGTDLDVATAIWKKKAPGCAYNGNTTVSVQDTAGYQPPYPTYAVTFERPDTVPMIFAVSIVNSAQVPAGAAGLVQQAIIDAFAGTDGGTRATIGSTVYASRYYGPIALLGSWAQIVSLFVGSPDVNPGGFTGSISGTTLTASSVTGALAIGQTIVDGGAEVVLPGTRITGQLTGSPGGNGTYSLTLSQTVSSRPMVPYVAAYNSSTVSIDQVPTINAANIVVSFV